MTQRVEPIRSAAIRNSANGAPCMLEFPCCNHDPATSVWAHWRDETFGRSRKAHDTSGFPACSSCHQFLDVGWVGKMELGLIRWYVIRAMQRAFVHLVETGAISVKLDAAPTVTARPVKPRKPKADRVKIPGRPMQASARPIPNRPFQKSVRPL